MEELDLSPRTRGRPAAQVAAEVVRELTPEEIGTLNAPRGSQSPTVMRLRESHHALARALATPGVTNQIAGAMTGYSVSRISILLGDPAFQELVSFYREIPNQHFEDFVRKSSLVRDDALHLVHEKILDHPEDISIREGLAIIETLADRTGHGPATKSTTTLNVNVDLATRLAEGRKRAGLLIDVTPGPEGATVKQGVTIHSSQVLVVEDGDPTQGAPMPLSSEDS